MTRKNFSARLPQRTINQIKGIATSMDETQAHVIIIAVDRLHQQEMKMKIFQVTTDKYGDAVYNTTAKMFLSDIHELGYDGELYEQSDQNGVYYTDDDGDCVLVEYNQANIDDSVVMLNPTDGSQI